MREVVQIAGRYAASRAEAQVSLFDRGYLLGDAVFETFRVYRGRPFQLERHLARLIEGASLIGLELPTAPERLAADVLAALARGALDEATVRVTLSRGEGPRGIGPEGYGAPVLSIVAAPHVPLPPWAYDEGVHARVVGPRRIPPACLDPRLKAAHYLPQIVARRELTGPRELEGVMLTVDGAVCSGLVSNVFVAQAGRVLTPPLSSGCLPGTTRALLLERATSAGLPLGEASVSPEVLEQADEVVFTSALVGCLPVAQLGGRRLLGARGPVTQALSALLRRAIEEA
jgi:branched-chain amino acid aminotransferase